MLFERTAISKQPDLVIEKELVLLQKQQVVTPQLLLKDPYILDFLDLHGDYMRAFAAAYPDLEFVHLLGAQIP
jgi:predicted nuclease of restriction endonuclease-like (RecB) superfamily